MHRLVGIRASYFLSCGSSAQKITLKNIIKPNSIQALNITKNLYSSKIKNNANELYFNNPDDETREDKTTFNYRLYLSNGTSGELQLASLREY